jgi:type II secretory pathway component GspD/PulD (secretin)
VTRRAWASLSRRALAAALVLVGLVPAPAAADSLVYRPRQRLASELLPLAQVALGGEGTAAADPGTNSLVLVGPRAALERALELLAQQDRPLRNVVVHYESRRADELDAEGLRVDWQVVAGDLRVGNVVRPRRDGFVAVRPEAHRAREQGGATGMLRVLEGQPGRIAAGVELPVTTRTRTRHGVREDAFSVPVESGLEVIPHLMGDGRVRLEIAPFDDRVVGHVVGGPVVERTGSRTSVTLAPGERVAVASLVRDSASSGESLGSGIGSARSREERVIVVWVDLE